MRDRIIDYIKTNRISTTEVADCLGKSGLLKDAVILNKGKFRVGVVKWVYAFNESNWSIHEQIRNVSEGDVVFIEAFNCNDRATIGELVSKYILLYKKAEAIISNTNLRDGSRLIKEGYPIWCKGLSPIGCFNQKTESTLDRDIYEEHYNKYEGSIAVCDDGGVVIIPKNFHTKDFYESLVQIEKQEDVWFDCLDRKKWDTFDIVCLKRYLDEEN